MANGSVACDDALGRWGIDERQPGALEKLRAICLNGVRFVEQVVPLLDAEGYIAAGDPCMQQYFTRPPLNVGPR